MAIIFATLQDYPNRLQKITATEEFINDVALHLKEIFRFDWHQ